MSDSIGYIVGGGLREGFHVRLTVPADEVQEGSFVVCDSGRYRYYGLVTDLRLGATDPRFADEATDRVQPAIRRALLGKTLFTTLEMYPTLMLDKGPEDPGDYLDWQERVERGQESPGPKPVKTVPAHHASVRAANEADVAQIFGEAGSGMFTVGHTIEQNYPVRLDLDRFVKRSSGIFGATGTGKSFLTRMVLAGLMKEDTAAAIVFDMHNEYGFDVPDADGDSFVKGLKSLFGSKVQVASLDTNVRGNSPDFTLQLAYGDILVRDVQLLAGQLNLTETAADTLGVLTRVFGQRWLAQFMKLKLVGQTDEDGKASPDSVAGWARENGAHPSSAEALYRRLRRIADKEYVVADRAGDPVKAIVEQLENGRHVILSFGQYDSDLDYMLVSNILTRRLREHWVERTEKQHSQGAPPPRPLVIAIEEAHKLLNPQMSRQTTFGTIARELRKYFVTLLVVDQRPSGIDDEVMSQLGTRITGWLGDEDDIRAVLTGLAGREQLRGMLARLQEKEEVLLLGWGVKMPIPIKSRRYDENFYKAVRAGGSGTTGGRSLADINKELGLG